MQSKQTALAAALSNFDFIEGDGAAPVGRGQGSISKGKYGPSGDKP
jgi:hypothetical protein